MVCVVSLINLRKLDLVKTDRMHTDFYHNAIQFGKHLISYNFLFQHDNDPKHYANVVKAYLEKTHTVEHYQSCFLNKI